MKAFTSTARLKALARLAGFMTYLIVATSILGFALFEMFPGLLQPLNPSRARYYAVKSQYIEDDALVFRRRSSSPQSFMTGGDQYGTYRQFAGQVTPWRYQATFNELGFRPATGRAPYRIATIGDSFVEFGESDEVTISALLAGQSGESVANLGHSGYGPYQYLQLMRTHLPRYRPDTAVVFLFAGNDLADVAAYEKWRAGGKYYDFGRPKHIVARYFAAMQDIVRVLVADARSLVWHGVLRRPRTDLRGENVGIVDVAGTQTRMAFSYWGERIPPAELVKKPEWQSLGGILRELRDMARESRFRLVVVLVPSKLQTYAGTIAASSAPAFRERVAEEMRFVTNTGEAMAGIARESGVELVDLLPVFRQLASQCHLYYPFDSHWSTPGRTVAAALVAQYLPLDAAGRASWRPDPSRLAGIAGCKP